MQAEIQPVIFSFGPVMDSFLRLGRPSIGPQLLWQSHVTHASYFPWFLLPLHHVTGYATYVV